MKLVLTGAAGRLGSYLREPLSKIAEELVSTDIEPISETYDGERFIQADISDLEQILEVTKGADMVVHFGSIVDEAPFETLLGPNFIGSYNIWEAAHRNGVRRVVYASSIHAVGMYPKTEFVDTTVPHRPDSFYGLAKCFSEDLGRMYWEKRGVESVCMRIFACASVNNTRSLGAYLSYDDLVHLVERAIDTPIVGFTIVYGISNNDRIGLDNSQASFLGFRPKDNAEVHAQDVFAAAPQADPQDPAQMCHGGAFAATPLGQSGLASMNVVDKKKGE